MKKLILLTTLACMAVSVAFAKRDKTGIEYQNLRGPFVTNPFSDNWFMAAGAGVDTWYRLTQVEGETYKGFDEFSYVAQFSIGKWLHPYYGVRVQFNHGNVKAGTSIPIGGYNKLRANGEYVMDFNYWALVGDALLHFSNLVGGYKEARFYNAILFAGVGIARSYGQNLGGGRGYNNEPALGFGLINTFRIDEGLSIYVEMKGGMMHQNFSLLSGSRGRAMIPSLTLGMSYRFKDRKFYTEKTMIDKAVLDATLGYDKSLNTLESELNAAKARNARLKAQLDAKPEVVVEKVVEKAVVEEVPFTIFFPIGQTHLNELEQYEVYHIAEVMKANPDKAYTISGYADKATGNAKINKQISEARVENVRKVLVDKAGVNPDQLTVEALGDKVNPFDSPEMNRVVVIK
jgi:outer membrane protein OmpA-like peptidoglycan-associated protein